MISEEKMILKMKKRNPYIIVTLSILLIFLITIGFWTSYQVYKDTQRLIRAGETQNQSAGISQPNLYLLTLQTSKKHTTGMFIGGIAGLIIGCLIMALTKNPLFILIVSMWGRIEKLEQKIQSDHESDSCRVGS